MATMYYGNEAFDIPDDLADGIRLVISKLLGSDAPHWLPMPVRDNPLQGQHHVAYLLITPGVPIRFEFDVDSHQAAELELRAFVQRVPDGDTDTPREPWVIG